MGKSSRPFPTGHFRLNPKKNASDDTPLVIQLQYVIKGRPIRRSTGYSVKPVDWDKKSNKGRGGIKASYGVDYRNLNQRLVKLVNSTDERLEEYCEKNPDKMSWAIAAAVIDQTPESRDDRGIDFVEYVNEILRNEKDRNKIGQSVYKNGLSGMKMFSEFLLTVKLGTYATDKIYVSEISISIVEKYINWRRTVKKNTDETINHSLTPILKGCKKAAIEGYISQTLNNSIQGMRIVTTKSLENDGGDNIRHLSTEELKRLAEWYENDREPRRREYVEMFMFAMYACGLRLIDMMTLRWVDIDFKKQVIRKVQVKTRNRNVIPIREAAIEILDRCKGLYKVFVFGMLSDKFDLNADEELRKRRNSVTATINTSLKRQSKFANLDKEITFHWTRHTWTVLALEKGVEISKISRLLDHTSTAVTEKVYAEFLPDTLGEVVDGLDFKF